MVDVVKLSYSFTSQKRFAILKRPTQNDVARLAGVSRATVSYVLNQREDVALPISEETRQRVIQAVAELGYHPDARATALRSGDTKTIGLLLPDLYNPHYWQILNGVEQEARESGYRLLLEHSMRSVHAESAALRDLAQRRVDGMILVLLSSDVGGSDALQALNQARRPIVNIGMSAFGLNSLNLSEYVVATRELMAHLLALGHRRIGFVYGVAVYDAGFDRLNTYKQCLSEAGLPVEESLIAVCGPTIEDGYKAARRLLALDSRPSALVVIADWLALGAMRAATDLGLRIPADVSIAAFDDTPMARYLTPSLTTVHKDTEETGRIAVRVLLQLLQNPDEPAPIRQVPSYLIVRESTGPARR
jgi:LacI family transcriptional regulator